MSLRVGQRTLFDISKENAIKIVQSLTGPFLIFTNDVPVSYLAVNRQQALGTLSSCQLSSKRKINSQVFEELNSVYPFQKKSAIELYYFSDFQKNIFELSEKKKIDNIQFKGMVVQQSDPQNLFIDTAFFESLRLKINQQNKLIIKSKFLGTSPKEKGVITLSVNGQVKGAVSPNFKSQNESADTLSFFVNDQNWQKILLTINDQKVHFDDSFAITAKSASELSVLVLNEGKPNLYIQAALRSYNGFKMMERSINDLPSDINDYQLIVLNGISTLSQNQSATLLKALQNGQSVCFFFGPNVQYSSVNASLGLLANIQLMGFDTSAQSVSQIQKEHPFIKEIFDRIPDNVQLPFAKSHYQIKAGMNANQQSVFSFRNGDPFFAQYTVDKGRLFLCATILDNQNGNFQSSYFLVPFLFQMASASKEHNIFAISSGQKQPIYVHHNNSSLLHLIGNGIDAIPLQKAEGKGVMVYAGAIADKFGFYSLKNNEADSTLIGVNLNRAESDFDYWALKDLKQNWKGNHIVWQQVDAENLATPTKEYSTFPLWKLCAILALIMLGIETYLLSRNLKQKQAITP
jgi:hypothetical protein